MPAPTPSDDREQHGLRVETAERLDRAATFLVSTDQWQHYLSLAADNPRMSAANLLLLYRSGTTGAVDSAQGWRSRGRNVSPDAPGTRVLTTLPGTETDSGPRWRATTVYSATHTTAAQDTPPSPSTSSSPQQMLGQLTDQARRDGWLVATTPPTSNRDAGTLALTPSAGAEQHVRELAEQLAGSHAGTEQDAPWIAQAAANVVARRAGMAAPPLPEPPPVPDGSTRADYVRELTTHIVRATRALTAAPEHVSGELAARVHTARARATETRERAELGAGASTGPTRPASGTEHLAQANEAAARYFAEQLQRSNTARSYLTERIGADAEQLPAGWRVGYAPPGWTALRDHLRERGFTDETLLAAGLAQRTQRGGIVDRFHHRLMVGVHNQHDQLTGFTGRTLHPDEETTRKYLNTPATELYDKSSDLLGITEQRGALADGTRQPLLVEGPLDALALAVRDPADRAWAPISTSGTAVTPTQLNHIDNANSSAPLMIGLDGDEPGRAATERIARLTYASPDRSTRVLELPDGHDPASYLNEGGNPSPAETTGAADWLLGRVLERHRELEHPEWVPQQAATLEDAAELLAPLPTATAAPLAARLGAELEQLPLDTVTSRVVQAHLDARSAPQRATTVSSNSGAETASAPSTAATPSTRRPTAHQPHTTTPRARPTTTT